jgi:hypothetical protein
MHEHLQKSLVPVPFRPAILRALAGSGVGKRNAICKLLARLNPICFLEVRAAESCLRNSRPSALAHHFASYLPS